jgi:uncharacterized protein
MKASAAYWTDKLQLTAHIEGGAYARTYTAGLVIPQAILPPAFKGNRPVASAIYFLLEQKQFSAMHRIAADELWHFYDGDPLVIYEIDQNGLLQQHRLGNDPENGCSFQCLVKAGSWFGSKTVSGGAYSLVGCTVSPGFDFDDFELGQREALISRYPQHADIITLLTRV